jgi:Saxitoxin biosynthesis operon protein SxtJ
MAVLAVDWNPDRQKLRSFAVMWLVAFGLLGASTAWRSGLFGHANAGANWTAPLVLWIAALVVPAIGVPYPRAVKPIYVAWMAAAYPIAFVVSHVLLGVTYYVLFTLVGGLFRLIGRDALGLRFDRSAATYWVRRTPQRDLSRYFRRF